MATDSRKAQLVTSSDDSKIYAEAIGNPSNPSIVFVHGLGLSCVAFDNIFFNPSYNEKFYIVRYDMRGHGRSVKPESLEGYSSKLHADDFVAVMNEFQLNKPIFVGWSMGATVLADVAAHLPKDTLSGAVYLAALPYIGPVMKRIGTPTIAGFQPGLLCEDSVTTSVKTAREFTDSLFVDPGSIPWETKVLWIGMFACQTPADRKLIISRPQDPSKLFELGASGFPLLVISGTSDSQVMGREVVNEMKPHFKNLEVVMITKNGSHAVHYDNEAEVMEAITKFTVRVQRKESKRHHPKPIPDYWCCKFMRHR